MKNGRAGFVVFWIGALYIIAIGFVASFWARGAYRYLSIDEVRESIWGTSSPLFGLWASCVGIGSILAGVGILLYVRSRAWRIWLFGIGVFAVLLVDMLSRWRILPEPGHFPPLFGVGGGPDRGVLPRDSLGWNNGLMKDLDFSLIAYAEEKKRPKLGLNFSSAVGESLEVHGKATELYLNSP